MRLNGGKVYRTAVAYVVVAGGIIQLASAVFPAWEMPAWALRLVIILLLIGFPIALILAWALEVTPEGIRTTPVPPFDAPPQTQHHRTGRSRHHRLRRSRLLPLTRRVSPQAR